MLVAAADTALADLASALVAASLAVLAAASLVGPWVADIAWVSPLAVGNLAA